MAPVSLAIAIEAGGDTQALMILRTDKVCRLAQQFVQPVVYVDYLATAPWNQSPLMQTPRYRQCGSEMLTAAVEYSRQLGFGGRIGLHSLKNAESFYRDRMQMTDLGVDSTYYGLRYFELVGTTF